MHLKFIRFHLYIVQGYASDCLAVDKDKTLGKGFDLFLVMGTGKHVSLYSPSLTFGSFIFKKYVKRKMKKLNCYNHSTNMLKDLENVSYGLSTYVWYWLACSLHGP